ncbi:bifunctional homocysteine S-methyltransferase/methylenetetrahydrofolate reductase [Geomonas silvestris]|uniref:Bifunctional homocysteine S-methyltransferase/methylenetetrahydrofolate reductase n=1 Tax=Geomonas silvestris TaxID=2740184 RepID=A0A6V8MJJ2_9BACT|nr:bifunctional homocysteine S-methyltransferase/methylenetetrahydrofolate reductase [Geomonas silvestris]GFO59849.1 bifunctional homocysteine S-methyltransferase/methylenetetrahydrofolate reductase [Geomonas silvestris]
MGALFLDRVRQEVLVGDGAIGTMLYAKGVSLEANFEHLNLVRPQLVLDLHGEYLAAGAQVIETNTFGANFVKLDAIGLGAKVAEINRQGAKLARQAAAGKDVFVAGSLGPLGRGKAELSPEQVRDCFRTQSLALAEGGVDLLILETFAELEELELAVLAVKETGLPVVANLAFGEGARLTGGFSAEDAAQRLAAAGADLIGANCGAGPLELLATLKRLAQASDLPLAAYPNSGFPEYLDGRYIYRATPDYFAGMAREMVEAGASLVGGCCGTTPEHVREVARQLAGLKPVVRKVSRRAGAVQVGAGTASAGKGFLSHWGTRKVITVELDPPKGLDCTKVVAGSRALKEAGADAINLAENPLARVRMGNLALAALVRREVGIEVIAHVTCRDRNLIGLQSDLMGASLLGISSILAVTGDPANLGEDAGASSVFDLNSFTLIKLLSDLNRGVNALGNPIGAGTGFSIGAAFNPNVQKMEVQVGRLARKVANGAQFAQTQPIYDIARAEEMVELTAALGIPVLPGVLPLVSGRNAEFLHNEVPGIVIPDEIRRRMAGKSGDEGVREGLAIASEFIDAIFDRVGGFYLIPPFGKHEIATELVTYIKEKDRQPHNS